MKDLTYFLNEDNEYEGEVVEFEKSCPMFKKFNGGIFFNQLIAYIENGTAFDLYDDIIEEFNEELESEYQYESSYDYIRKVVLDNFDRICPMNGVKLGTLIGKIIDKNAQNNSDDEIDDDDVIEIKPLTDREMKGLTNTCYSLGVAELGIRIQYLIGLVIGENLVRTRPLITTDNALGTIGTIPVTGDTTPVLNSVDLFTNNVEGKYITKFIITYPDDSISRDKIGYSILKTPSDDELFIINKIDDTEFTISASEEISDGDQISIKIIFKDIILNDYTITIKYEEPEEPDDPDDPEGPDATQQ